jgi:hypothetical protein
MESPGSSGGEDGVVKADFTRAASAMPSSRLAFLFPLLCRKLLFLWIQNTAVI